MSSSRFLLDTNALSERRKRTNPKVVDYLAGLNPLMVYLSVLTIGELRLGLARKGPQATALAAWIDDVENAFRPRILPVTLEIAHLWGELSAGRSRPIVDTLLAATAIVHNLTLVTRNTKDFTDTGVALLNPWQ